ncbi:hypothetical protein ABPG72_014759 [Tetrahymena utriculariae]
MFDLKFIANIILTLITLTQPIFYDSFIRNLIVQLCIFIPVACIPAFLTKKMWFVDIAWPCGLTAIAVQILFFFPAPSTWHRTFIGVCYLFQGGRMFLGALGMVFRGVWSLQKPDLPRYQYAKDKFAKKGMNLDLNIQIDVLTQCFANIVTLNLPAFVIGLNPDNNIHFVEVILMVLWLTSLYLENKADMTKKAWLVKSTPQDRTTKVCDVGMWSWCRHPNYFFEWMTWIIYVSMSLFHIWFYGLGLSVAIKSLISLQLLFIPVVMYNCLVYWTGAKPAEHFSVQKRPGYAKYIETTPCFFPRQLLSLLGISYKPKAQKSS